MNLDQFFTELLIVWAVFTVLYLLVSFILMKDCCSADSKKIQVDEHGRRYYITPGGWPMYIDENGREYSKGLYGERVYEYDYIQQQRDLEEEERRLAWEREQERRALNCVDNNRTI
ncbi:MAG: hypothetical protein E7019_06660 [Alphaproteobacteria bacterium]|nr:hypothetical protein [Alphaproteobacteria bacterium]